MLSSLGPDVLNGRLEFVVAIPVCNEEERIGACLRSLAEQDGLRTGSLGILLFLNNCTDRTRDIVGTTVGIPWAIKIIEMDSAQGSAGWARRLAMNAAAEWLAAAGSEDGIILTTDADSRVGRDWVAKTAAAVAVGADGVAGRIVLDPSEAAALPPLLHARGRLEAAYEALLIEIGARLDPTPGDPWPCHWTNSGATLAVRRSAFLRIGGLPDKASGEDHALVEALQIHGFRVRHDPDIEVVTSGRLIGRAFGGVADTMRLRCEAPDTACDERLEHLGAAVWRYLWRRRIRKLTREGRLVTLWLWAPALAVTPARARSIADLETFGRAYGAIETASPRLAYHALVPSQLPRQIRNARMLVRVLRMLDRKWLPARRVGNRPFDPAARPPQPQSSTI